MNGPCCVLGLKFVAFGVMERMPSVSLKSRASYPQENFHFAPIDPGLSAPEI